MPLTRDLPMGRIRRLIMFLLPNGQSLFLDSWDRWVQKIKTGQNFEGKPSSQEDKLPTGKSLSLESLGTGETHDQAAAAYDSASAPTLVNRAEALRVEDVDDGPEIARTFDDLEVEPDADATRPSEERTGQTLATTMVETLTRSRPGSAEESNYLPENLAELFVKKEFVNPQVKALLYDLDSIDCRELADELHEFARSVGAVANQA